ncbi:MAG: DUF2652 domain-containing protein [Cucumibacter sp.]
MIADISGYTRFLAGVELDHAQDILADLIGTVVTGLRPPFRLAKLEGDAAFVYSLADAVDGSLLQDSIESTYFAFRRRLRDIKQATVCQCDACRQMATLDLKFVVHHGQMAIQAMAGQEELVGRDVILVHRLLKSAAGEKTGRHAYAMFSDACIRAMGIDAAQHRMLPHSEMIDAIGEAKLWIRDLEDAWTEENGRNRVIVAREDAALLFEGDVDAPRPLVWEYFTLPEHRPKWQGSISIEEQFADGRRGVGTVAHCAHGAFTLIEHVLDFRPFDYLTVSHLIGVTEGDPILITYVLSDAPGGGTHVEARFGEPSEAARVHFEALRPVLEQAYPLPIDTLKGLMAGRQESEGVIAEPSLPQSSERFISQPVT